MNILSVNKFYWKKGGSEAVFFAEKALLEEQGHQVIPFSMQSEKNLPSEYSKYFVDEVDYTRGNTLDKINAALKIIYSFDAKNKMKWLLSDLDQSGNKIDLAHFHIFQHQISPSVFAPLREKNIPIILTLHDLKPICPNYQMYVNGQICEQCKGQKFYHCTLNKCTKGSRFKSLINSVEMYFHYYQGYYQQVDKYIAVSQFHRNKMIEFGFPAKQIDLIPNSIDCEFFSYSGDDKNYAIFIGRLSKEKGIETLVKAAQLCPDISIKIVGTGPLEKDLKKQIEEENIKNIQLLGYKTGIDLLQLIALSSFSIIPSIVYENCPMSILESFATGKPVIGSNIGGIPELIDENKDGLVFKPNDEVDLAEKMQILWGNKETRIAMGKQARQKVELNFNKKDQYKKLMKTYKSVYK